MKKIIILLILSSISVFTQVENANHQVGVFLGASSGTQVGGETALTIGLEYEYLFNQGETKAGIGFTFDAAMYDNTLLMFGVPFYLHIFNSVRFIISPSFAYISGWEDLRTFDATGFPVMMPVVDQSKFFMRFSGGYEFKFQNYVVTPAITADVISSHLILLYGIDFAITF